MAMVNGKIVGSSAKKVKKTLSKIKAKSAEESKPVEKKKKPIEKKTSAKKKTRKETSEPETFRIQIGPNSFLSVDLAKDDKGEQVVAVRKWYNTKNDPEIKPGRGGFNIQPKSPELKLLALRLRDIARVIDESKG